jgi:hypothetical protein
MKFSPHQKMAGQSCCFAARRGVKHCFAESGNGPAFAFFDLGSSDSLWAKRQPWPAMVVALQSLCDVMGYWTLFFCAE